MKTASDYRAQARQSLGGSWTKGNWGVFATASLIVIVIESLLTYADSLIGGDNFDFLITVFDLAIGGVVSYAFAKFAIDSTNNKPIFIKDVTCGFDRFIETLVLNLINSLLIILWSFLLIIPGIIKAISYSMSFYVLYENPEMTANQARIKSMEIMEGHKMDYFVLILSFIGWFFLGALTFGILYIWIIPYINTACAEFYNDIKPAKVGDEQFGFDLNGTNNNGNGYTGTEEPFDLNNN